LFLFVWFSQALPPGPTPGTLFFLGIFNQRFAQTLPSHSILLECTSFLFINYWLFICDLIRSKYHFAIL
jgi:hypothetical protein